VKRSRRGGRRPQNGHNGHNGGNGGGGGHNPNRTYDSTGPEVKIRGSSSHIYEKYLQLARDANASGDRVMAENYLQHAEHYYRIMAVTQAQIQQYPAANNTGGQQPRLPNGSDEQPSYGQPTGIQQPTSGPSFSLADTGEDDDGEEADGNE
jgi:hypothetical protein